MLRYKIDVLAILKKRGYSQYRLRTEKILGGADLEKLRNGLPLGILGLDTLCGLLKCQPGRILEWVPDEEITEEDVKAE